MGVKTFLAGLGSAAIALSCGGSFELIVAALSLPQNLAPGQSFHAQTTVCNQGEEPSVATTVEYFVMPVGFSEQSVPIGTDFVAPLALGECTQLQSPLSAPFGLPEGEQILMARLEAGGHLRTSPNFGLGLLPDLVLESLDAPHSVIPGSNFEVTGEICNRGTTSSSGGSVELYLSPDLELIGVAAGGPSSDVPVGGFPVPPLVPDECALVTETAYASVSGDLPYLLGAIVDEFDQVPELIESNNRNFHALVGVGAAPDLVVQSLTGPPSAWNGQSFEVQGEVCNLGTMPASATQLSVYASEDATLQVPTPANPAPDDPFLGTLPVPPLLEGQCTVVSGEVAAFVPHDGAWFLAAMVDEFASVAELIEFNNSLAGALMGIGDGPDLVVRSLTAPPSAETSSAFDVDVRVCNQGTAGTNGAQLRLFLSQDTTIEETPPDFDPEVGSFVLSWIDPGGCSEVTIPAWAGVAGPGPAFLLARVEGGALPELVEANNDFVGPLMGLGSDPDLVISALAAPASVLSSESFEVAVTVCNQGTSDSQGASIGLYHSPDPTIESAWPGPGGDLPIGQADFSGPLLPGACRVASGMAYAPYGALGAFYLGAIVDEFDDEVELIETNNVFAGPLMGVGDGPDLVVTSLSAPPSTLADTPLEVGFEVCNQGTNFSAFSEVGFYDSPDALIEGEFPPLAGPDRWLGNASVPPLAPGACHGGLASLWVPSGEEGERVLGAIADDWDAQAELIESNNAFAGPTIGIGSGPDLIVTRVQGPASVESGAPLAVDTQVCNQGTAPSQGEMLIVYLSEDTAIEGSYLAPGADPWLVDFFVPILQPGACHDEVVVTGAYVPYDGAWYLGAIVDEGQHSAELIESNNALLGSLVGIGFAPDLYVSALTLPPSASQGQLFPFTMEVCNQGTDTSPMAYATLYVSADETVVSSPFDPNGDLPIANVPVPPLLAGECTTIAENASAFAPQDGAYFVAAIVDDEQIVGELIESNNQSGPTQMGIGLAPDLVVAQLSGPASVQTGAPFSVDLEVCNQGTETAAASQVALYHSSDTEIDGAAGPPPLGDSYLGEVSVSSLAPGACSSQNANLFMSGTGPGYLGAVVDEFDAVAELIESNNRAVAGPLEGI